MYLYISRIPLQFIDANVQQNIIQMRQILAEACTDDDTPWQIPRARERRSRIDSNALA
jgi:hypothetical protein